jgi:purine-nucleoside phosphorylase
MSTFDRIQSSLRFLENECADPPKIGLITGSGLGSLHESMAVHTKWTYDEIPNFRIPSAPTHAGYLYYGKIVDTPVMVLSGRYHAYEGLPMHEIVFPVRVLAQMGIEALIVTNVAGGLNTDYDSGDLVIISDHINLTGQNPLRGYNDPRLGSRFPDMSFAYDLELRKKALAKAEQLEMHLHQGVYAGVLGPSLETKAEYTFLHRIGADLVGMSTIPEVIAARHMNVPVLGISVVSNTCFPISAITETTIETVIEVAGRSSEKLNHFLVELIKYW